MNAFDDLIQAAKDMDFHGANYYSNASIEARERAEKACRELFPPMAKALVWSGNDGWFDAGPYRLRRDHIYGGWHAWFDCEHINSMKDLDAAKAACEAHHQSRFLELLA